ncbi:MAG TPA: glycosyltransferase family 39 protein [Chthoniobacterales bacterium]|nr:glycosyltransferase family 39 protein [Chthoniobacterales bacterium]
MEASPSASTSDAENIPLWTEPQAGKLASRALIVLLVCDFLLIIFTFRDYGMSWDQAPTRAYGESVVHFYSSLGQDTTARTRDPNNAYLYGGLFEILSPGVERLTRLGWPEARNLTSALFGLIGIWAAFRLGAIAFGPIVGLSAALFLSLTPVYYGHAFINPKDIPFAALYALSLSYVLGLALEFPELRWSTTVKAGLAIGGALGMRVGGLILLPLLAGSLLASAFWNLKRIEVRAVGKKLLTSGVAHFGAVLICAWLVMLFFWPFAWKSHKGIPFFGVPDFRAPFVALQEFSKYGWLGRVFFEGHLLRPSELPAHYLLTLFANSLPEFVLAGWILGIIALVRGFYQRRRVLTRTSLSATIIFVAGAAPITAIIVSHALLYDNFRQVLFTIPPLIVLSAAGVWAFARTFQNQMIHLVLVIGYTLGIVTTVADMRALHPYEYIYFNRLIAGGMEQANQQFEMEYWGTSFREAALWLKQYYRPPGVSEIFYSLSPPFVVPELAEYYLQQPADDGVKFRRVLESEKPHVCLMLRRGRQYLDIPSGHIVHTVKRQGIPLLEIVEP